MTAPREAVEAVLAALLDEGAGPGNSIHSWRCEYPDMYGPCDCVAETAQVVADAAVDALWSTARQDTAYGVPITSGPEPIIMTTYDGTARKFTRRVLQEPWTEAD